MIYLHLFIIAFLCVFVIDYSGFIEEMDNLLTKALKSRVPLHIPKPASCSLCSTTWLGLLYLIIVGQLNFYTLLVLGIAAALTPEILSIIYFIKDLINKVFDVLERLLNIF